MSIKSENEKGDEYMKDLYGYKDKDVVGLLEFIKKNPDLSKSRLFSEYAKKVKKAKGTVRNMYYATVKAGLSSFEVKKIFPFSAEEERKLIKDIINLKRSGKSVRSAVIKLACGDAKKALRYQNKYRNALAVKPELIKEIEEEIKKETGDNVDCFRKPEKRINEVQFRRLKSEIDALVLKISENVRNENDYLKRKIAVLERENERLLSVLYKNDDTDNPIRKLYLKKDKNVLN